MRVRRIMKIFGGVGDGYFGFQQYPGGIVHFEIAVILFWGNADFRFENTVQIVGLVASLVCQLCGRDAACDVVLQICHAFSYHRAVLPFLVHRILHQCAIGLVNVFV